MFAYKPDFPEVLERYEAWWECRVLDRPLVSMTYPKPEAEQLPLPVSAHAGLRERWMDTDFVAATAAARKHNTVYEADALPVAFPNLGPEIFSAFYGCEMEYGEQTAWSKPMLQDWSAESLARLQLNTDGFYYRKVMEMTDALLEVAAGKFIVGYTDLHGGADALAAFRDPQELLIDTIEHREDVQALCERITTDFLAVYDTLHEKLSAAGMPSTTWITATCRGKMHVPSNDFSCMISDADFEELFLPGILRECAHMDRNIYHLDGPLALRYLDRLLEIPDIHAIQWVPGAGQEYWGDWIEVYQRIQAKNKAMQILAVPGTDLPRLFEVLNPEGVWISSVSGITNQDEADTALKQISAWTGRK